MIAAKESVKHFYSQAAEKKKTKAAAYLVAVSEDVFIIVIKSEF